MRSVGILPFLMLSAIGLAQSLSEQELVDRSVILLNAAGVPNVSRQHIRLTRHTPTGVSTLR